MTPAQQRLPLTRAALEQVILQYLNLRGWLAWGNATGAYKVEDQKHGARYLPYGKKGSADIFAVRPGDGKFYSIEVKVGADDLSDDQRRWMKDVRAAGGVAVVARDLEDVMQLVEQKAREADREQA